MSLGGPYRGRVAYVGAFSVWRRAMITLAGALADLVLADLVLAGSAAVASGQGTPPLVVIAADVLAMTGLVSLMPYRVRSGELSDGAQILELRSGIAAAKLQQAADRLLRAGRTAELLELHAGPDVPGGQLSMAQAVALALVEYNVAVLPGRLPDSLRRAALAAVVKSWRVRGLPYDDVQAAAATLVPPNPSPEAMAAAFSAVFDPDAAIRAFRHGDPGARLGAGSIATLLRRQGRIGELLELHAGFGGPGGQYALEQVRSLENVEYNVLLVPGLPPGVLGEAASRVQWIAANYPHEQRKEPGGYAALEHTLAVARLRQGRFADVEPLCAPGLAAGIGPDDRATTLATIALARRALGPPHADLLAEAIALSPDADLVAEARRSRLGRESQPQPFGMT